MMEMVDMQTQGMDKGTDTDMGRHRTRKTTK